MTKIIEWLRINYRVGLFALALALLTAGISLTRLTILNQRAKAERKELERQMRLVQESLSIAEAKTRQADLLTERARVLGEQNNAAATAAQQKGVNLDLQTQEKRNDLEQAYARDRVRIADAGQFPDPCARCRDIAARLERLKTSNSGLVTAYDCSTVCNQ